MAPELQIRCYMMDKSLLGIALLAVGLGGCGLDSGEEGPAGPQTPPPLDEVNEVLCTTDVSITGTMVPAPKPPDYDPNLSPNNCWAVGVWTFRATPKSVNDNGKAQCSPTSLLPEYKVEVLRDATVIDAPETYKFLSSPSAYARLKVSSGGGGLCEGIFEIYSSDGTVIHSLHPALQAAGADGIHPLDGKGEYQVFKLDQRPPAL
jgi:hypothetical protein